MVRAFEVLCPFFNIRSNVPMFLYFFEMKLTGKIGWVLLSSVSKKMFEFKSNVFHIFKDCFFKPSAREGGQTKARVNPPRAFEADEEEVFKVTPNVLPPVATKRKRNEGARGSDQRKKLRAPFSL
ncbi:hypothetical protein JHK82_019572 [Glycine max]|nr:hypothetical protein JHK85_020013 [Glycine max]KAG5038747.1 hypothetical protein JHK86_019587 [Glycine max]KAG5143877.1 hypothetical protein JHK82_019572 [Glycine max]